METKTGKDILKNLFSSSLRGDFFYRHIGVPLVCMPYIQVFAPGQENPAGGTLTYPLAGVHQRALQLRTVPSPGDCQLPDASIWLSISPNFPPSAAYTIVANPAKRRVNNTEAKTIARSISSRMIFESAIFCIIEKIMILWLYEVSQKSQTYFCDYPAITFYDIRYSVSFSGRIWRAYQSLFCLSDTRWSW